MKVFVRQTMIIPVQTASVFRCSKHSVEQCNLSSSFKTNNWTDKKHFLANLAADFIQGQFSNFIEFL